MVQAMKKRSLSAAASESGSSRRATTEAAHESIARAKFKTSSIRCHIKFMLSAFVFVLFWSYFIFEPFPVKLSDGVLGPLGPNGEILKGQPVHTGERVAISWTSSWSRICELNYVPVIIDSSRSTREFKDPAGKISFTSRMPTETGTYQTEPRDFIMPPVVGPVGEYYATIYPQCWYDKFLNRSYITPSITFQIANGPKLPAAKIK